MIERRKDKRITKIMDLIISSESILDGMVETLATCRNISERGIQVEWDTPCQKDDILYLRCFSNTTDENLDLRCQVVWCSPLPESQFFLIGLKFLEISTEESERLLAF